MIEINEERAKELQKSFHIPPRPAVLAAIQHECEKENPSIPVIAEIVSEDVSLAAGVLKAINSPIYGLSRTVTDINQSIVLLGLKSLQTMVNCYELQRAFSGKASISIENFWNNSVQLAKLAVTALPHLRLPTVVAKEDIYAAALFQDCGIPPMALRFEDYDKTLELAKASVDKQFTHVEEAHHMTNHAILGYFVANSWHLPKWLCQHILIHHERNVFQLGMFDDKAKSIYASLKIISNVLNKYRLLDEEAEWKALSHDVLAYLHMSDMDYQELELDIIEDFEAHQV